MLHLSAIHWSYYIIAWNADLTGTDLSEAILIRANLLGAIGTTPEQLAKAQSLQGATMPDGSIQP
jgi:uncharacterized protein YjbI with pentapeptide repeats